MGKKSTPQAPAAPDPVAVSNAQADANTKAAVTQSNINRIDQYTPQGSLTYSQVGTWPDGTPRYQQTQSYSPEQQKLYDQQNQVAQALGGLAQNNIGRVQQAQAGGINSGSFTPLQTVQGGQGLQYSPSGQPLQMNVGGAGQVQSGYGSGGGVQSTFNTGGPLTSNVTPGQIQNRIADAGNVQTNINFGEKFNPGDFNTTSKAAADALYSQASSRLDPQYQQLESDMRARLINSGISENSEAYRREMDNFARQRTDAYNQATYSSIGAGLSAQQQGYNQALGTRQQNSGETLQAGQFANNAQGQIFGQNAAQLQAWNDAQAQQFGQGFSNAQLNNAAQGQQYQQNMGAAQFGNEAQQQRNQQNMQLAAFGNAAQDQRYQQELSNAGFNNQAAGQQFAQDQATAGFNNQTQNQGFNQNLAGANLNNQVRQQQFDEASYLRNLPLNDIAALLGTGGGVQNPNFQPFAQAGVAAPDYQGAVYANYNAQNQQYQQAQQARSQGLGSIFGLAGSLGSAAIMSDRRVKHAIRRIGTLANGLNTYVFSYLGSTARHFGVMAQEVLKVKPEAVGMLPSGFMYVNYGEIY